MVVWDKWMRKGTRVMVFDKLGKITRVDKSTVGGVIYVKYIYVKIVDGKFNNPYFPEYVKRIK